MPSPLVDIETSNWFVSTNPGSPFVSGLIVGRRPRDGSIEILSDGSGEMLLTTETIHDTTKTKVDLEQVPQILKNRFGLPGFEINSGGSLVPIE